MTVLANPWMVRAVKTTRDHSIPRNKSILAGKLAAALVPFARCSILTV